MNDWRTIAGNDAGRRDAACDPVLSPRVLCLRDAALALGLSAGAALGLRGLLLLSCP